MNRDFLKDLDSLFDNNKKLIDKLIEEKRLLESMFLDNRVPEELKKDILEPYNALNEVIDKRIDIYKSLKQAKEIPDMVGLIYNERQQNYLSSILKSLQELSERRNIKIVCFTLGNIDLKEGSAEGLVVSGSSITQMAVSLPNCNLNIGNYLNRGNSNKIRQMYMQYNSRVVNPVNVFNQAAVFDTLAAVPDIKKCLLPVSTLSPSIITEYLENTNTLFLLPERGLHNNAAIKIERKLQDENKDYCIEAAGSSQYCDREELYAYIKKMIGKRKYVVVQGVKSLVWNGLPLEVRAYVQKGIIGKWDVTEMIAKNEVFVNGSIYKNTVDELDRVLRNIVPNMAEGIERMLENLAVNICSYLDHYFLLLGSCTVDFIVDEEGRPFLLAFGGWDYRDYLYRINGKNTWNRYLTNSIDYLLYLKHNDEQDGK